MSNVININDMKVSAAFAHLKRNKGLGDGIAASGFPILNIRGKTWRLRHQGQMYEFKRPDDGSLLTYLDVVILNAPDYISKIYFGPPGQWNEDSSSGPICAAIKGDRPDPGVPEPQNPTCAGCRQDQWIDRPGGGRAKPCQDHKRLAVLLMPSMTKQLLGAPLKEPVYFKVPPGSLGSLKAYGDMLDHANLHYAAVLTRLSFDKDKQFQINFDLRQTLEDREAPLILPLIDDPRTLRIIGETPTVREVKTVKPALKPVEPTRINTGLLDAFDEEESASPPPPKSTRVIRAPDPVQEIDPEQEVIPPPPVRKRGRPPAKPVVVQQEFPEEPADEPQLAFSDDEEGGVVDDLDDKISALLNQKTDSMLK